MEESIIDYFIVCPRFLQLVTSMDIDEQKIDTLTKYTTRNGKVIKAVPSDHNMLRLEIGVDWANKVADKIDRVELYDYANKDAFKNYVEATQTNDELDECFRNANNDINEECIKWISKINTIIKTSFKKIRIKKTTAQSLKINSQNSLHSRKK